MQCSMVMLVGVSSSSADTQHEHLCVDDACDGEKMDENDDSSESVVSVV